ncbi:unnamed protein product [Dibothriocephalus latus]|uniref:Uncharacterized protein n=1 Tax=Dibothriocephalus latus TaxID=60516 RepID=A0A3P7MUQ1_DIBLA|nr:unnamed protein product [Dibothriocephalus latus]
MPQEQRAVIPPTTWRHPLVLPGPSRPPYGNRNFNKQPPRAPAVRQTADCCYRMRYGKATRTCGHNAAVLTLSSDFKPLTVLGKVDDKEVSILVDKGQPSPSYARVSFMVRNTTTQNVPNCGSSPPTILPFTFTDQP